MVLAPRALELLLSPKQSWPRAGVPTQSVAAETLGLGPQPCAHPGARGRSQKVVCLVPSGIQLAESLDDHAVDFLKVIDVLSLGCQSS